MTPHENQVGILIVRFLGCANSAEQASAAYDLMQVGLAGEDNNTLTLGRISLVSSELALAGVRSALDGDDAGAHLLLGAARAAAARLPPAHQFRTMLVAAAAASSRAVGEHEKPAFVTVPGGEA